MGYETSFDISPVRISGEGDDFWTLIESARGWRNVPDKSIYSTKYAVKMSAGAKILDALTSTEWEALEYVRDAAGKFYEWQDVFLRLSKAAPEFQFNIEGRGEEAGDWWVAQFLNGKKRIVMAVMPNIEDAEWVPL